MALIAPAVVRLWPISLKASKSHPASNEPSRLLPTIFTFPAPAWYVLLKIFCDYEAGGQLSH
jgi:hypothetical protein